MYGLNWKNCTFQGSLYAPNTIQLKYFFYHAPYDYSFTDPWPLAFQINIPLVFLQGDCWNWEMELPSLENLSTLGYLIQILPAGPLSVPEWVLDPGAKESIGGAHWGKRYHFLIDDLTYTIHGKAVLSQTNGLVRLPVVRQEPETKLIRPAKPQHPLSSSILYECHVRGMTCNVNSPASVTEARGTYQGLIDCLPHLKQLGVTAIELLPIFDFDETENRLKSPIHGTPLLNYWGYSPLFFLAPKQSYALQKQDPIREFKEMVDAFHEAGMEVILDVVYNHTAEQDSVGPAYHFKKIALETYYWTTPTGDFLNDSGCGNTLRAVHPVVKDLIHESLLYWTHEMGVDGFRFDLATLLNKTPQGEVSSFPQWFWEVSQIPELKHCKFFVEPWDAVGNHQLGAIAPFTGMSEWNDSYRDTIRHVLLGDHETVSALKNALLGSPSLYGSSQKGVNWSLNYVTCHDGMTLWDLVSFSQKHNFANGESNRDGSNHNLSYDCGIEGHSEDKGVLAIRLKKVHLAQALLFLSHGVPMILAGDEMGRTQQGNNNAYCQDNPLSWLNWMKKNEYAFLEKKVIHLIQFRKQYREFLFSEESHYEWFNMNGAAEDLSSHIRTLAWQVSHPQFRQQVLRFHCNWFHMELPFVHPPQFSWKLILDTGLISEESFLPQSPLVSGFSLQIWIGTSC